MSISSSFLQVSKKIYVKTINDTTFKKWERFPKHSRSQELFEFVVVHNIIDAILFNPYTAIPDTFINLLA